MGQNFPVLVSSAGKANVLTAATTFYVDPAGNDSNDGTTPGTAKLTIQAMINELRDNYDAANYNITIQLANGTYDSASGSTVSPQPIQNSNVVTIQGDIGGNNSLVTISNTDPTNFVSPIRYTFNEPVGTFYRFKDLSLSSTVKLQGDLMSVFAGSICKIINVNFATLPAGPGFVSCIAIGSGAIVHCQSAEFSTSSPGNCIFTESGSMFNAAFSTLDFTGSPAWTGHFGSAAAQSIIDVHASTLNGTPTGSRGLADGNSTLVYGGLTGMGSIAASTSNGGVIA